MTQTTEFTLQEKSDYLNKLVIEIEYDIDTGDDSPPELDGSYVAVTDLKIVEGSLLDFIGWLGDFNFDTLADKVAEYENDRIRDWEESRAEDEDCYSNFRDNGCYKY